MSYTPNMRVRGAGLIIHDSSVLLVEYYSEGPGLHYVLPGGAVHHGETVREAVRREVREEACVEVEVGQLVLAYEYAAHRDTRQLGAPHALTLVFTCRSLSGAARLPDCPDRGQTGVRWVPLDELDAITLSPPVHKTILEFAYQGKAQVDWIEEWKQNPLRQ
jgi:ADP-ribose pyrophosphatase YjhB (NUDIX family)